MSRRLLPAVVLFASLCATTLAAEWDCHVTLSLHDYDLTLLGQETVERTRENPPSQMVDRVTFDLCKPIQEESSDLPTSDKCPPGTYACLTTTNKKAGVDDRIVTVVPLATSSLLDPTFSRTDDGALSVVLHGPAWPTSSTISQALNVTLICGENEKPIIANHESDSGVMRINWRNKAACPESRDPPENTTPPPSGGDGQKGSTGSGIGWFFFLLFFCFITYFGLGAYYNYNNYGASGWDLVPHRDFWRDVPYLFRDLFASIFSNRRSYSGARGGYVSV